MGERKVLKMYLPPDFDPTKLPKTVRSRHRKKQRRVIIKLPMSIWCKTCGNHISKETKVNCRKEDVDGETYLGIQICRFNFRCTRCEAELIMKTDPQNSGYIFESEATTIFQPLKDEVVLKKTKKKDEEEVKDTTPESKVQSLSDIDAIEKFFMPFKLRYDAAQKEKEKQMEAQEKKFILYLC